MPSHEVHCHHSLKRYGKTFSDLHSWMDEPVKVLGRSHRLVRHDVLATPRIARLLFGELADQACIDHILLDFGELKATIIYDGCTVVPTMRQQRIGAEIAD